MSRALSRVGSALRVLAALAFLVIAGRFAFVAIAAYQADQSAADASPSASGRTRGATAPSGGASAAPLVARGQPIRTRLFVNQGPDRAEIWIGEELVGRVPYAGDLSCHEGEPLRIRIKLGQSAELTFDRVCSSAMIRVDGDP